MLSCYLYLTHMLLKPKGKALAVPWGTSAHKGKGCRCILSISAFTSDSLPRWPILREDVDRLGGIGDTVPCC